MSSGVATRPIEDFRAYRERLTQFVFRTGSVMKPIFSGAANDPLASTSQRNQIFVGDDLFGKVRAGGNDSDAGEPPHASPRADRDFGINTPDGASSWYRR